MVTKFLIVALCILSGTMGGLYFSRVLARRDDYYRGLISLINAILSEIKFRKSAIKDILKDFAAVHNTPLNTHINQYIASDDFKTLSLSRAVLKKDELDAVLKFFLSLGTTDSETQIFELENYKNNFIESAKMAEEKRKKFAPLYIKLGFLFGLCIGIIII